MLVVFYISGHGFGHATRSLVVIDHILTARPDCRVVVRTSVPAWFLAASLRRAIDVQPVITDTGVAQIDSLRLDEDETARRAAAFYRDFDARVDVEAAVLQSLGAALVVGDIPPLAFAAADRAGIPSVAFGNFTWDWIYAAYPAFETIAPGTIHTVQEAYSRTRTALRLPFPGGFASMERVTRDVPLVARRSSLGRQAAREALDLSGDRPVVLASFGGHGAAMPYEEVAEHSDITLVVTDYELPEPPAAGGRLRRVSSAECAALGVRYEDLVAAADVVVTKPGYGIVSECIANGAALLYTSRGRFAEHDVMVERMPDVMRCRYIAQEDLRAGRWQDALTALVNQPPAAETMAADGAPVVAREMLRIADDG